MYDTLTETELSRLAAKLSRAGNGFYHSAMAIADTALHLCGTGRIEVLSPEWNGLWELRAPIVDAMDEMHQLMNDVDDTARTRRTTETTNA